MLTRRTEERDLPALAALWGQGGYRSTIPPREQLLAGFVATLDGRIVAWAGYQMQAEVMCMVDKAFPKPERAMALQDLHLPVAREAVSRGAAKAVVEVDPAFGRFGRWLEKRCGWTRCPWGRLWIAKESLGL